LVKEAMSSVRLEAVRSFQHSSRNLAIISLSSQSSSSELLDPSSLVSPSELVPESDDDPPPPP
jgi:hypothetical protein